METKKALFELVAEKLITQLEEGTSAFQQPWTDNPHAAFRLPYNPTTSKNYKGLNTLWLSMQGRGDPRWLTFKQAESKGWTVNKGSKGTMINFVKTHDLRNVLGENSKPILDLFGKPVKTIVPLARPVVTYAWVFNAEQISGIPDIKKEYTEKLNEQKWINLERAEIIIRNSDARIKHGGNEAYYRPGKDYIQLPEKEQFDSAAKYYSTLLHEMGHWTGHKDRLDRSLINHFGTPEYAREELRAEIASLLSGSELGIGHNFGQHAAYVASWIKVLQDDPFEIHRASAAAQQISDYILAFEQKIAIEEKVWDSYASAKTLLQDEVITYKSERFKVLSKINDGIYQMENISSGQKFKLRSNDGLYSALLEAKAKPVEESPQEKVKQGHSIQR